ncbi:TIGR04255 family protein [Thermus scotoductus]|uniref:TIGR04255 family protein n=1 Tax=Thermus scotoductus TaxID=37636 RepID=UPI00242D4C6A|nr:TIGR04255 family protein [Thermus scotoductus]
MGKKYRNPPLVEAICEFRLTQNTHWDLMIPGLFYEGVKNEFPHREQRSVQELQLIQGPQGIRQELRVSERALLFSPDRKLVIQLGPHILVVNALKPYPTWEGFKPRIEMAWKKLQEIMDVQGLERIGLRYINRIELPQKEEIRLSDSFVCYLIAPPRPS